MPIVEDGGVEVVVEDWGDETVVEVVGVEVVVEDRGDETVVVMVADDSVVGYFVPGSVCAIVIIEHFLMG